MKNSSKLELTIERNFTLSRRGFSGSCACSRTLLWNSNKLSSRLMYNSGDSSVRSGERGGASEDCIVTDVAAPEISSGSSESDSPIGELCIGRSILLDSTKKKNAALLAPWKRFESGGNVTGLEIVTERGALVRATDDDGRSSLWQPPRSANSGTPLARDSRWMC